MKPATLIGFDFGLARIGLALGNTLTGTARALAPISADNDRRRFEQIGAMLAQWQPDALVVGVPRHRDGAAHPMTERCERFARQLEGRFGLPVFRVDERYSSVAAESELRSAGRQADSLDSAAAAIILQQYLDGCTPR